MPIGLIGTAWSYWKLKEIGSIRGNQKIDVVGNVVFGAGLTLILIGVTYGLLPYESSAMGWSNPWVIASFTAGAALLAVFPFIERRVQEPMFRLELFKIRMFSAANFAGLLSSISRGGVMIMLTILLQGIWLPLHGFSYEDTPFWAGVFMIPMLVGFILMGPISGWLSDKYGARGFATVAMIITAVSFLALTLLPYNFDYLQFAVIIFFMGVGGGMFAAPNTASIMNSVPPEHRGVASGMMATLQNIGQTSSLALFFTIVITSLANNLPAAFTSAMTKIGVPQLAPVFSQIPPTGALFAAFLGYNPMQTVINQLPDSLVKTIAQSLINHLTGFTFFPNIIAPAFMSALKQTFYLAAALSITAALFSVMRGRIYVHGSEARTEDEERKS